jgi:hypothetical protein
MVFHRKKYLNKIKEQVKGAYYIIHLSGLSTYK